MKGFATLFFAMIAVFSLAQNTGLTDATSLTPQSLFHIHRNAATGQVLQLTNSTSGNGSASTGMTLDLETNFNVALKNNYQNSAAGIAFWTYTNGGSLTEKLRISNAGCLGIGINSPQALLHVFAGISNGLNEGIRISGGSTSSGSGPSLVFQHRYGANDYPTWKVGEIGAVYSGSGYGGELVFYTNTGGSETSTSEKIRITKEGNLIPAANNSYSLGSSSNLWSIIYGNSLRIGNDNFATALITNYSSTELFGSSGAFIDFKDNILDDFDGRIIFDGNGFTVMNKNSGALNLGTNNTTRVIIDQFGHMFPAADNSYLLGGVSNRWSAVYAVNGTIQTSDIRFKKNVQSLNYGLAEVLKLNPVRYQWKTDTINQQKIGFIAQDVLKLIPEVVNIGNDANKTHGINYAEMNAVLVKAIQEQQKQIEDLKQEIITIKSQLKTK
ncbi:MAG: tail fiber domain-containing protein [Bacteroidota bacterium]